MGVGLVVVALLIALMQGAFCKTWNVTLPQSIISISHSCVIVPCLFSVPNNQEANILNCSGSVIWRKGSVLGPVILNSVSPFTNVIQGEVVGDITKKNCTTIFHNFQKNYSDIYYFRLECLDIKYTFTSGVSIVAQADPAPPQLTFVGLLSEGAEARLQCSVPVPCSILPPTITWLPRDSSRQEKTQMLQNADGQTIMTSTLTFIASADHHNQNVTCGVSYPLVKGGSTVSSVTTQRLNVLYAPRFTLATLYTSGPVSEGSIVTFTCSSDANPPVSRYTWYRYNSENLTEMGNGDSLFLRVSQKDSGVYLCEAHTPRGSQRSRPVVLEIKATITSGTEYLLINPYIISGVAFVLCIITVIVTVLMYKSLSRRLKKVEQKGESAYISLKTCSCSKSSEYDQLQSQRSKTQPCPEASDYENLQERSKDQPQHNQT